MSRVILHSDANSFYASVEILYRPELKMRPVAVCGSPEERHGIVLTANRIAKGCGVKTGMAIWQARQYCPGLVVVPPNYHQYIRFSKMLRSIYMEYTNQVESYGLDECWLDVSGRNMEIADGKRVADEIRKRVREELGITVSVGVANNKVYLTQMKSQYKLIKSLLLLNRM